MHRLVQSACQWPAVVSGDLEGWQAVSQADAHDNDLGDVISFAAIEPGPVNAGVAISPERFDSLLEQVSNFFASQTSCLPWWLGVGFML